MRTKNRPALPDTVSMDQWQAAHNKFLKKEKAATHERDALAAERRRMPMVEIEKDYAFEGPDGRARLLDLFDGRRQLIVYILCSPRESTAGPRPAAPAVPSSWIRSLTYPTCMRATRRWC
jgi:predicted dithiol-disulfide oxidoreductase (DUF899 family)